MSRVLAVLAAIALIVGAVAVRGVLDDEEGDDRGGADGDGITHVVCGEELAEACADLTSRRVEVRIEPTPSMAAHLSSASADDAGVDVWVVPMPWPEIVEGNRDRAGLTPLFEAAVPLGRSDLAAVVPESIGSCDWGCLGDRATDDLRVGGRPLDSGLGLVHLGAFASGHAGTSTFATNDVDPAFESWLDGVHRSIDPVQQPVTRMLQIRASFDVAITHRVEAERVLATASEDRRAGLTVTYPEPMTSVVAVAAVVGDPASVPDGLEEVLAASGWSPPGREPTGLPSPGVLTALLEVIR